MSDPIESEHEEASEEVTREEVKTTRLSCNIAMYRPDPAMLAANYRPRDVARLLTDAASLIDRCIAEFRDYCSLDYAWNHFMAELVAQQEQLDVERRPQPEAASAAAHMNSAGEEDAENEGVPAPAESSSGERGIDIRAEVVQRKKELAAPGQPFALNEQRDMVLKRVCRDYEEALNRACVAEEGLKSCYGHQEIASPLPSEAETLSSSITNLTLWIRDAGEWLARYEQKEEAFTQIVSVRSLLSRSAWAHLRHSRDTFPMQLEIPAELFRSHDNCRLRGIGASVVGEVGTVPWSLVVRLPNEALYERSGQRVNVDQSVLPACLLGKVENARSARPVEICGATSLINASPIGRATPEGAWTVNIYRPAGSATESFGHLEDLLLEIHAVGTPKMKG